MATPRSIRGTFVFVFVLCSVVLAACGGSDSSSDPGETPASTGGGTASTVVSTSNDASATVDPLGYRITAAPGTELTVEVAAVSDGVEQSPLTQTVVVDDEPRSVLFTVFVDSVTLTVSLDTGAEATVETIRGHSVDPDDPFGPIEVTEVLETASVTGQEPVVLSAP